MQQPWVSVCNDAGAVSPTGPLSDTGTHPRAYGSFPRILGKYVREEHVLRPEDAVRKFSSLPAQRMKLDHRGLLRPDYFADITIFDPAKVLDVATFENPKQPRVGIEYVRQRRALPGARESDGATGRAATARPRVDET
jgi:N-acyl-D-aspartate/D-glutamate deacylase